MPGGLELRVQTIPRQVISRLALSADGTRAVSVAGDDLSLWDVRTGALLRLFGEVGHPLDSVALSPNGRQAATGGQGSIRIWDLSDGKSRRTSDSIFGITESIHQIVYLPDGHRFLSCGSDGVKLWNADSGARESIVGQRGRDCSTASITRNGHHLITGGGDGQLTLWRLVDNKPYGGPIRTFTSPGPVQAVAISSDGTRAVFSGYIPAGPGASPGVRSSDPAIWVWELASSEPPRRFPNPDFPTYLALSRDAKTIVAAGGLLQPVELVDARTMELLDTFSDLNRRQSGKALIGDDPAHRLDPAGVPRVSCAELSADGKLLLTAHGHLDLWDVSSGTRIRSFPGHAVESIANARFTADGKTLLVGGNPKTIEWDVQSLHLKRYGDKVARPPDAVVWSRDGQVEVSAALDSVDLVHRAEPSTSPIAQGHGPIAISGDDEHVAYLTEPKPRVMIGTDIIIQSPRDGRVTSRLSLQRPVSALSLLVDGSRLLVGDYSGSLQLLRAESTTPLIHFRGHSSGITAIAVSPDGARVAASSLSSWIVWSLTDGRRLVTAPRSRSPITRLGFSPDGQTILIGDEQGGLQLARVVDGKTLQRLTGHWAAITAVTFSPDGRLAVSTDKQGVARMWNTTSWESVALVAADAEWITYADDGYFDSSKRGGELIAAVGENAAYAIEQFAVRTNRPDILLARLGVAPSDMIEHFRARYQRRLVREGASGFVPLDAAATPVAHITNVAQTGKFVDLSFELTDHRSELTQYNVFVNNVPLFGPLGKPLMRVHYELTTEHIELTSGVNRIEVSGVNAGGSESLRDSTTVVYTEPVKGDLYFVAFGVSKYRHVNVKPKLEYADQDAIALTRMFGRRVSSFKQQFAWSYVNEAVTPESFRAAKQRLAQAKPDDLVVVHLAGHGTHDKDANATFHFLTSDTVLDRLAETSVSMELIEDLLQGLAARRKLLLIDVCRSGEVDDADLPLDNAPAPLMGDRVPLLSSELRYYLSQTDRYIYSDLQRHSGAVVFAAARGDEIAYEDDNLNLEHGWFSYALLELLQRSPPPGGASSIGFSELYRRVAERVKELSNHHQHPTVDRDNLILRLSLPYFPPPPPPENGGDPVSDPVLD